jgi:Fe-S-cluster containining protein
MLKLINLIKRNLLRSINKNYINDKLKKRTGSCKKCGKCCKSCWHLNKKTNLCKVYDKRPWFCYKDFPIEKYDKKLWKIQDCGYEFEE